MKRTVSPSRRSVGGEGCISDRACPAATVNLTAFSM
jgi:hypothetical protein